MSTRPAILFALLLAILLLAVVVTSLPAQLRVEIIARGLEVPWDLAVAPDGRIFVTERPGRLRVIRDGRLEPQPVAQLPVAAVSESGLMGLAIAPRFAESGHLYVCYTARKGDRLVNRVSRLTVRGMRAGEERVLLDDMPGAPIHDGCRLRFGPDGKLYVTMGDAAAPRLAQQRDSLAGKILRIEPDGTVPGDNPFPGSPLWSLGHRNPQGIAWDAAGRLVAAEHGPSGHDEINAILPGRNYGWPEITGRGGEPRYVDPILESGQKTWAPSGIAILGPALYVACLRGQQLLRVELTPDLRAGRVTALLENLYGRLRAVVAGPDGALYVTTSNRDGRGSPAHDDDRVLRVRP